MTSVAAAASRGAKVRPGWLPGFGSFGQVCRERSDAVREAERALPDKLEVSALAKVL